MKLPKDRDGFAPQGNKDARFIDQYNLPYLKRHRPGHIARTRQGELDVIKTKKPAAEAGFYLSTFWSTVNAGLYTSASRTASDVFRVNLPMYFSTNDLKYKPEMSWNFGKGYGVVGQAIGAAGEPPFDSDTAGTTLMEKMRLSLFLTRNGRDMQPLADMPGIRFTRRVNNPQPIKTLGGAVVGTALDPVEQDEWCGVSFMDGEGGLSCPVHFRRFTNGTTAMRQMGPAEHDFTVDLRFPQVPQCVRLSPNVRVALLGYSIGNTLPGTVPVTQWCVSLDAGETWAPLAVPEYDDQFIEWQVWIQDVEADAGSLDGGRAVIHQSFSAQNVQGTQLNATQGLIYFSCPKVHFEILTDGTPQQRYEKQYSTQVMSAVVNLADGSFDSVTMLWDSLTDTGFVDPAGSAMGFPFFAIPVIHSVLTMPEGGVLVQTKFNPLLNTTGGPADYGGPRTVHYCPDGVSYINSFTMPFGGFYTGTITGKNDGTTLVCPMWDEGIYGAYTTVDRGATWVLDGKIAEGAQSEPFAYDLQAFNTLDAIRLSDGTPSRFQPAAPWCLDVRVPPP